MASEAEVARTGAKKAREEVKAAILAVRDEEGLQGDATTVDSPVTGSLNAPTLAKETAVQEDHRYATNVRNQVTKPTNARHAKAAAKANLLPVLPKPVRAPPSLRMAAHPQVILQAPL